jgi:hypothetical protein
MTIHRQLVCDGTPGLCVSFTLQPQNKDGVPEAGLTGTAKIDDYASAFVVDLGSGNFQIIPKITLAPGAASKTVTVVFDVHNTASGKAAAGLTVVTKLMAPPIPDGAAQVVCFGPVTATGSGASDPGSDTLTISL